MAKRELVCRMEEDEGREELLLVSNYVGPEKVRQINY